VQRAAPENNAEQCDAEPEGVLKKFSNTAVGKTMLQFHSEITASVGAAVAFFTRGADIQAAVAKAGTGGAAVTSMCIFFLGVAATVGGRWLRGGEGAPFP
jgi:hypothetical protein